MQSEPEPQGQSCVIDDEIDDAPQIAQADADDVMWEMFASLLEKHGRHDLVSAHADIRHILERDAI